MKIAAAAVFLFLAGLLTASAIAQSAAPGAPVINRVITADFNTESFTFHWRPPDTNNQNIIGYHIRRQQNIPAVGKNAHPARCDELTDAQWRWSDSGARTDYPYLTAGILVSANVFSHTEQTRPSSGSSHGNCYRWHIAAFTQNAVGTAAVTNPILSRPNDGRQGCERGSGRQEARPWVGGNTPYSSECTRHVESGEWCHSNGGTIVVNSGGNAYECRGISGSACTDGGYTNTGTTCRLARILNTAPGGECTGPGFSHFSHDHRECVCLGWATPKPSGSAATDDLCECTVTGSVRAFDCECDSGTVYNPLTNECGCPAGEEAVSGITGCHAVCAEGETRVATGVQTGCFSADAIAAVTDCENKGWDGRSLQGAFLRDGELLCAIPSRLYARNGDNTQPRCVIEYGTRNNAAPSCEEMYGSPPVFPDADAHPDAKAGTANFVANCDRDETIPGGHPPNANTDGATECSCGEGHAGTWPDCRSTSPDIICALAGWTYDSAADKCELPLTSGGTDYDGCFFSGASAPQCSDVFGDPLVIPENLTGLALTLFNGFQAKTTLSGAAPYVLAAAAVYRDAVNARHNGDPNYEAPLLANFDAGSVTETRFIVGNLSDVFTDNGIAFSADGTDKAAARRALTLAFAMIPVRGAFVFNCGEGAIPATANTISATDCQCGPAAPVKRGRGLCAAECPGEMLVVEGECVPPTAANKCRSKGWTFLEGPGFCNIAVADFHSNLNTLTVAARWNQCIVEPDNIYPACADVFGADLNFPPKPESEETVVFPFNCDADGTRGLIPAAVNTAGANGEWLTGECVCADPTGFRTGAALLDSGANYMAMVGGRCETCAADELRNGNECVKTCPEGKVSLDRKCVTPAEKCAARGWDKTTGDVCHFGNRGDYVLYDVSDHSSLVSNGLCNIASGSAANVPDCSDVFGPNYEFPEIPNPHALRRYVYNCDPDGTRGLTPATHNDFGATDCVCADSFKVRRNAISAELSNSPQVMLGGECACPIGKVESADGLSCVCPADKVADGNSCVCPAGESELDGVCVSAAERAAAEKCVSAGWTFAEGSCAIPVSGGGTISASCEIGSGGEGPACADAFGEGLDFPQKPRDVFAAAAYVYDCGSGNTPSGVNENGETTCACPNANEVWLNGACVAATAENKCRSKGWDYRVTLGSIKACLIKSASGIVTERSINRFSGSEFCDIDSNGIVGEGSCYDDFGADLNFPQRPADGSSPFHAVNCGSIAGGIGPVPANNGLLPERFADGATDCYCADSEATHFDGSAVEDGSGTTLHFDGVCLSGESAKAATACEGKGWGLESGGSEGWRCAIPVMRGTLSASPGCYVSGVGSPECSEVFGAGYAFPITMATKAAFVFDCGEKMTPESVNLSGETMCQCAATNADGDCVCGEGRTENDDGECVCGDGTAEMGELCIPEEGVFGGVSGGVASQVDLCRAFRGEVLEENSVAYGCRGLDAVGTFCLLGSADAFPCRGLFLRARDCNIGYDRPLLNPFVCAGACPSGNPRGQHCE